MIELKPNFEGYPKVPSGISVDLHSTFYLVQEKIQKWAARFSQLDDPNLLKDLYILNLISPKKFLNHRSATHLFRLSLSIHYLKQKILRKATFSLQQRHLEIRYFPATLYFPFSKKKVLGCLIGFNVLNRYELFDEENVILALQKFLPDLLLVKDSSYSHPSEHKNFKIFYFEIEKKDGQSFSLEEQKILKNHLEGKIKKTIQPLSPTTFMSNNVEEIYKNILVLSQEIQSLKDLPQAYITLDSQTGKEIVFLVILVYISPSKGFVLEKHFSKDMFVSQRVVTVKQIEGHPVEAHIFYFHFPRDPSLLRSDGSLDFYSGRQRVVKSIQSAIGEFRDYNGGIIIQQQELLQGFKEHFPSLAGENPEFLESFFYSISPVEKQVVLPLEILIKLFSCFLEARKQKLDPKQAYSIHVSRQGRYNFLIIHLESLLMKEVISTTIRSHSPKNQEMAYNIQEVEEGIFFSCLLQATPKRTEQFIHIFSEALEQAKKNIQGQQTLRIGMDYSASVSLDPRIGNTVPSLDIIRLLFTGLTRFNQEGEVEKAIAQSIDVSADLKYYTFKLNPTFWNDGSPLTAYDFEYAWKKILSPNFKTSYAHLFYPIKNAKEAKEGKVSADQIGIYAQDSYTLKVELTNPTPYFLQLTSIPLYSPIHRLIDQLHPEWPYQNEKNYPCNGPFQLKINQVNQGFQLVKNPFYCDVTHTSMDQVRFTFMKPTQALQAFQKKEVDWIGSPFGIWDPAYNTAQNGHVVSFPNARVCWCTFNTSAAPFKHRKLRQAFAYAIQRQNLVSGAFVSLAPAYSSLFPKYLAENDGLIFPEYDKEKAQALFHEALKEIGVHKKNFRIHLLCNEVGIQKYTGLCLQQQFQDCFEVECILKEYAWTEVQKLTAEGNFEINIVHWTSVIDDPIYTLGSFKTSTLDVNFSKWEHPEFRHLISLTEQEIDQKKRLSYFIQAEKILGEETPIIPLYYSPYQALMQNELLTKNLSNLPYFQNPKRLI